MSSPLTWKNMYDSGLLDKSILTTQTGAVKDTNKSDGVKSGRQKAKGGVKNYQYPEKRSTAESEDTLLIKAIEYIPPSGNISKDKRGLDSIKSGESKGAFLDQIKNSGDYMSGLNLWGGPDGIRFKNAGGMDRRIEKGFGADPAGFQEKIKYYIELPIPQQINDSTSVTWGEDSMNIMQLAAAGIAQGIVGGDGNEFQKGMQQVINELKFPDVGEDTVRSIKTALAGKALDTLGANVNSNSLLGRATGQILNSNLELLFQGVSLRSFPFNVTFSPRSNRESAIVKGIIKSLKKSMSAKRGADAFGMKGGIFLKPPDVFLLRYLSNGKDHPFLNIFKPCALTNMSVNYTGAGTYATYGDATPVNIKVSLMFKEINPVYAEDYEGVSGVGF
tara:strand:+ start:53 stop:1219 length:1167 start_codon:yes stop_codon:yes gene_type:complete